MKFSHIFFTFSAFFLSAENVLSESKALNEFSNEIELMKISEIAALPFIIEVRGDEVYANEMFGIKICEILVDGKAVDPIRVNLYVNEKIYYTNKSDCNFYTYPGSFDRLTFLDTVLEGEYKYVRYSIPSSARTIVIRYWPRYPDGNLGSLHLLKISSRDSLQPN